jgi:type II secretory pathway predicted ATPase ExeA
MYAQYWGLSDTPFANLVDGRWFYESPVHEEALARLLFLVEHNRRCGVLFGPAGTGKSVLFDVLAHHVRRSQRHLAKIDLLGRSGAEMLWDLNAELGLAPALSASSATLWRSLQDHFQGNQAAQIQTIVLLDHLERADADCWSYLERLVHFQCHADQWTTLIIALRAESLPQFSHRLAEISDLRIELPALDRQMSQQYVETLLEKAGASGPIFEQSALDRLFEYSQGVPRELNRLCDLSLLAAMADGDQSVGDRMVNSAAEDLRSLSRHDVAETPRLSPSRL